MMLLLLLDGGKTPRRYRVDSDAVGVVEAAAKKKKKKNDVDC